MQADEIAEAVEELKSEGKIIDFGLSNFTSSQTELIRQKQKSATIKSSFRQLISNRCSTEVLTICKCMRSAHVMESIRLRFQERHSQTHRLKNYWQH
jgi:predicted oxidoreductase